MPTIKLEVVSPDAVVYQADIHMLVVKASDGEIGIMPNHLPMIAGIVLRQTRHGVIHRCITVRMIFTEDFTDDTGRFLIRQFRADPHVIHRVQDPALNRLQPVPCIRQCARDDHAHRIVQVGLLHLLIDIDLSDSPFRICHNASELFFQTVDYSIFLLYLARFRHGNYIIPDPSRPSVSGWDHA